MMLTGSIIHKIAREMRLRLAVFRAATAGSVTIETLIAFPLLALWYVSTFIFFDVFRANSINERAAYTIADMVSRQTVPLNDDYINGLNTIFDFLTSTQGQSKMRISSLRYNATPNDYIVLWSVATRGGTPVTTSMINAVKSKIPNMNNLETVILVETALDFYPSFNVGIEPKTFLTFIITRPRFAPQVAYTGS